MSNPTPNPLDIYLDDIDRRLRDLPLAIRQAERNEIAAHLTQLAEDLMDRGLTAGDAYTQAMRRFGNSGQVAQDLRIAYLRGQEVQPGTLRLAILTALLWSAAGCGLFLLFVWGALSVHLADRSSLPAVVTMVLLLLGYLGIPLCAGTMTALTAPRYAVAGVTIVFSGMVVLAGLLLARGYLIHSMLGGVWASLAIIAALLVSRGMMRESRRELA